VQLTGLNATSLGAVEQTFFREVIAENVGLVCGSTVLSNCTAANVEIVTVQRRSNTATVTIDFLLNTFSPVAADTAVSSLSSYLAGNAVNDLQNKGENFVTLSQLVVTQQPSVAAQPTPSPPESEDSTLVIALVCVGAVLGAALIIAILYYFLVVKANPASGDGGPMANRDEEQGREMSAYGENHMKPDASSSTGTTPTAGMSAYGENHIKIG